MKSKLGILGALILSLTIAGSAFAANTNANAKTTEKAVAAKTVKATKHRKHRRHRVAKKATTMSKQTTTTMTKKASPK